MDISQQDLSILTELFNHAWSKTTAMWMYILLDFVVAEQSMVCAVIY